MKARDGLVPGLLMIDTLRIALVLYVKRYPDSDRIEYTVMSTLQDHRVFIESRTIEGRYCYSGKQVLQP